MNKDVYRLAEKGFQLPTAYSVDQYFLLVYINVG